MNKNDKTKTGSPIVEVTNITTQIGGKIIHENLSLSINKGEILAVVGGSGSGKTTLFRTILLLQPIVSGKITVLGKDILKASPETEQYIRKNWGVLFQQGALFSSLTVLENVAFAIREQTSLDHQAIREIAMLKIAMVGLPADSAYKFPSELSGGMIKRAALARAIALEPTLLFLDEPTTGLDPQGATGLDELIFNLKTNLGLTIVMITHDVDTLWRITDRVAFLGQGKVLEVNTMNELYNSKNQIIHDYFNDPRSKAARHIREEMT